jgi:tetratricopeptide (TPR) repeat protein
MLKRSLLPLLALALFLPQHAAAQAPGRPYRFRIVLLFARHRLLTDVFRNQVKRQLGDSLQAAYDDIARVKVELDHPRRKEIERVGLGKALDSWKEHYPDKTPFVPKTHFVLISYAHSTYEVQTRQHDGLTGLPSPVVRRQTTHDPAFVARIAGLLVQKDFGLHGKVESAPDADDMVKVHMRGAGPGVDLSRWVKKNEVFALVHPPKGSAPGSLEPWTYLQVKEAPDKDGVCLCKLWHRYEVQADLVPGLWTVALGTVRAPLRLRLMEQQPEGGLTPLDVGVSLEIRDQGFAGEPRATPKPDDAGYVDTSTAPDNKGIFGPLAFVYVDAKGSSVKNAQVPVAVVSDDLVVVPLSKAAEGSSLFAVRLRTFHSNLYESLLFQSQSLQKLSDFQGDLATRIERERAILARFRADHERLRGERERLLADARENELPGYEALTLADEKKGLDRLEEGMKLLADRIEKEVKIDKEAKDPTLKKARQQVEQAKLLEQEGDVDEALALYEKAQEVLKSEALKKYLAELKEQWKLKSAEHRDARHFIYEVWPDLDLAGLESRIGDARKYFEVCSSKEVNDYHAARKLLKTTELHANKLLKRLGELRADINVEDEELAKRIKALAPKLVDLGKKIQAYLARVGK